MLTPKQRIRVTIILDTALGIGVNMKDNERGHYCPFCSHYKRKLQISLEYQKWHCWVCNAKGKRLVNLLSKLNIPPTDLIEVKRIYRDNYATYKPSTDDKTVILQLPTEFKSFRDIPTGVNPTYKHMLRYLTNRGITMDDIIKHNIGYCEDGMYSGRVIIPSYDKDNQLNYFIARTINPENNFKYKNPPVSKNIIAFENQVNWKQPITLCEGIFDAISIKRNVIPIFGKFIPTKLMAAIFEYGVTDISIMLDTDAQDQALRYTEYFNKQGIKTKNIISESKDANEMGFSDVNKIIKTTSSTSYDDLIKQKLNI